MVQIAVIGYGTVGSGVVEVIQKNSKSIARKAGKEIKIKYIADIRKIDEDLGDIKVIPDAMEAINDPEVSIIVETIGGIGVAYKFTKAALEAGKSVVTSNKELVATYGPELLELARKKGVCYLFEASVGGGIPIIRPLSQCLAANEIKRITGILNGTTNYILSKMNKEGMDFETALRSAQEKGYAERDPSNDIEGHDACRKIAILSSIAFGQYVNYKNIPTEGIASVTPKAMKYAASGDYVIKLIARCYRNKDGKIFAKVSPSLIPQSHPLSNVEEVFNGILVEGDAIGDVLFYGKGAGKLPTASAVVADVIDIVKHAESSAVLAWPVPEDNNMASVDEEETRYFVLLKLKGTGNKSAAEANPVDDGLYSELEKKFGKISSMGIGFEEGEFAFLTDWEKERNLREKIASLESLPQVEKVLSAIEVLPDGTDEI